MSRGFRALSVILLVALGLRLAAAVFWQEFLCPENRFFFGDSDSYWQLARTIAEGKPYEFSDFRWQIFRTPGYPAILAPLFLLFGENPPVYAARILGAVSGTLTVAAVAMLANRLFPLASPVSPTRRENEPAETGIHEAATFSPIALWAALLLAVEPTQIVTSVFVLSEAPFCLFMVLQIFFRCGVSRGKTPVCSAILSGVSFAAAVYVRPSWILFVPFAIAWETGVFLTRIVRRETTPRTDVLREFTRRLLREAMILLVFCMCMSPWWIRNARISGHLVVTTLQSGPSLYDGLNPEATGASDMRFVDRFRERERDCPSMDPETEIYEYRLDRRMRNAAIDWAKTHPRQVVHLAVVKCFRMWNLWPNEPSFSKLPIRVMIFLTFVPTVCFAAWGIAKTWNSGFEYRLCRIPVVYFTLLHIVFVGSLRYRIPPMIFLDMFAAAGFVSVLTRLRGRTARKCSVKRTGTD